MEQPVNFKLAELAASKGFNSDTFWQYNESQIPTNKWIPNGLNAPTVSDLIKWIRNEHKMNVYCRILNKEWGGYIEQIPDGIDITPHELIMKDFESYDLAIIVALFVALSLI